jgi:hypothetical protein
LGLSIGQLGDGLQCVKSCRQYFPFKDTPLLGRPSHSDFCTSSPLVPLLLLLLTDSVWSTRRSSRAADHVDIDWPVLSLSLYWDARGRFSASNLILASIEARRMRLKFATKQPTHLLSISNSCLDHDSQADLSTISADRPSLSDSENITDSRSCKP